MLHNVNNYAFSIDILIRLLKNLSTSTIKTDNIMFKMHRSISIKDL